MGAVRLTATMSHRRTVRGGETMWQMTWDELTAESFKPNGKYNRFNGIMDWFCPVCGLVVGIESTGMTHEKGWLYKRDKCKNGHIVDWT